MGEASAAMADEMRYRRLKGRSVKHFGFSIERCSLYRAEDHVLSLRLQGFSEHAHRFYYADIEAITCEKTQQGAIANAVFASLLLLIALACIFVLITGIPIGLLVALSVMGAVPFAGLVLNLMRGPTCTTTLYTATDAEPLDSLGRLRTAVKVLDTLRPLIEAAQGRLDPTEMRQRAADGDAGQQVRSDIDVASKRLEYTVWAEGHTVRHSDGHLNTAVFTLLLLVGFSHASDIFVTFNAKNYVDSFLMIAIIAVTTVALVKQHGTNIPGGIRLLTGIAMAAQIVVINFMLFAYSFTYTINMQTLGSARLPLEEMPDGFILFHKITVGIIFLIFASIGLAGLLAIAAFRNRSRMVRPVLPGSGEV